MEPLTELRKHVQSSKLVIGTDEVIKLLKHNKVAKVFAASNCPKSVKEDLKHYSSMAECELLELAVPNDELGILCKKPFSISVVGVLR
jgi:large subunit ribosomal protein L30e